MKRFLAMFWGTVVSLAGVVGLYIGAAQIGVLWAFWLTLAISVLVAGGASLGPRAIEVAMRFRNYPTVLARVVDLEKELDEAKEVLQEKTRLSEESYSRGVGDGHREMLGAIKASIAGELAISEVVMEDGRIFIISRFTNRRNLAIGARFNLQNSITGEIKGAVEIEKIREDRGMAYLGCVSVNVPEFWEKLTEHASLESAPPRGLALVPCDIPAIEPPVFGAPGNSSSGEG